MDRADKCVTSIMALMSVVLLLLSQLIWFMPIKAEAETAGDELVIRVQYFGELGDKIREKARFSRSELEAMGSEKWYYSNVTSVGTVMTMAAYGPEVTTIIENAGIDLGSIKNFTFKTTDGYTRNYTVDYHLKSNRYYYPNLSSCYERNDDGDALTPTEGALDGGYIVPSILALQFAESKTPGINIEDLELKSKRSYRFCIGQTELSEGKMTEFSDISSNDSSHSIYGIDITLAGSPIKGLSLDLDDTNIKVGSMKRISASFNVEEAFEGAFSAEDLTWTSSDESIATVNSKGEVKILKEGSVTITATAPDGTTAEIVINGTPGEKSKEKSKADKNKNKKTNKTSGTNTKDNNNQNKNKTADGQQNKKAPAKQVTFTAREIKLGDMVVEEAAPQDEMRSSMAEDAQALDEAKTYSRGAAAGAAAGAGLLCGAGALSRIIMYRRQFGKLI